MPAGRRGWRVDAVAIDNPRLDEPAQLQHVMPVPPIPCEPGGVQAQDRPDLAGAERRHQPLESRTDHGAASGAAKVVVDDRHLVEAVAPGHIDQFVLPALALQIAVDLRRGGLADIDHRLTPEHAGRQKISVCHCQAPPPECPRLP
jgi:hypothetical protein